MVNKQKSIYEKTIKCKYNKKTLLETYSFLDCIELQHTKCPVISIVGAGGKTTLIKRLAEEYREKQIPVIVTTTTHMRAEDGPWFLLEPSLEKLERILTREGMVWIGLPDKQGKMKAPSQEFLREVLHLEYPVIIEADGAKMLPLKVPEMHEPVIIPETTHVLNVYGLDALGKPLGDVCFRKEQAEILLEKKAAELVMPEDIVKLALSHFSGKKDCAKNMQYYVVLNKADSIEARMQALAICYLAEEKGFSKFLVAGRQKNEDTN